MVIALILFIIPLIWIVFAKFYFHHQYSWKEAGVQFGISILSTALLTSMTYAALHSKAMDTEILNGEVRSKYNERVSCSHSYRCNCVENTDSNGNKTEVCQTCYYHPFDINWVVDTTIGNLEISRINSQGTLEPPRYTRVEIGEPASLQNSYSNFVKANPDSIFNTSNFAHLVDNNYDLPNYPEVHDYYRVNRVLVTDPSLPKNIYRQLNESISMELRKLGHEKEVNVVLVLTSEESTDYAKALEYKWLGGKKNDVVIVMGISEYPSINWVKSFGWSSTNRIYLSIEDSFQNKDLDTETFAVQLSTLIREHYTRRPFEEFKYLMDEMSPPLWSVIIAFILNAISAFFIGRYFLRNEL